MYDHSRRVPLTVPPELDMVLDRLVLLQNKKKTKIILDVLMEMKPVFEQLADALEAVEQKKDPTHILNALVAHTLTKFGEMGSEMKSMQKKCADTLELPL
jgi:hypothetical protein